MRYFYTFILSKISLTIILHLLRYQNGENGGRYPGGEQSMPRSSYADRTYSLPRTNMQNPTNHTPGYYTQDRRGRQRDSHASGASSGADTPDFYFMPSQRKYSGEVVRVYVDYNKDPKN